MKEKRAYNGMNKAKKGNEQYTVYLVERGKELQRMEGKMQDTEGDFPPKCVASHGRRHVQQSEGS